MQWALGSNWFAAPLKVSLLAISGLKLPTLSSMPCSFKSKYMEELTSKVWKYFSSEDTDSKFYAWRKDSFDWEFGFWPFVTWSKLKILKKSIHIFISSLLNLRYPLLDINFGASQTLNQYCLIKLFIKTVSLINPTCQIFLDLTLMISCSAVGSVLVSFRILALSQFHQSSLSPFHAYLSLLNFEAMLLL